jgi:hypothetical protein
MKIATIGLIGNIVATGSFFAMIVAFLWELTIPLQQSRVVLGSQIISIALIPFVVGFSFAVAINAFDFD